ncbi:MAG: hypothetical protein M3Z37_02370 [Candidatus Eremiobacteraeota bacterium]|nr:hypothetical protein [Candidatus Eremiobacteraeota bacterium]
MNRRSWVVVLLAPLLLWSCSHSAPGPQGAENNPSPTASTALQNPIDFPLVQDSTVIATKKFSQTLSAGQRASGLLSAGAGTYDGNEVIAGSPESFSALQSWLRKMEAAPPPGYTHPADSSGVGSAHAMTSKRGVDFAVFRDAKNSKRAVLVLAIDPALANRDLGPALGLVKKYQMLPGALRGNIDGTIKRRTGISIEQLTQPGSPLALAMTAMGSFSDKNRRAVVLVDAAKQ